MIVMNMPVELVHVPVDSAALWNVSDLTTDLRLGFQRVKQMVVLIIQQRNSAEVVLQ